MPDRPRRIGILAGGGTLPLEFAQSAAARGELVQIVALDDAADADFGALPVTRVGIGQVGRMLRVFRAAGANDIVIIGPARRPDLWRIRPDTGFFLSLPAILKILASGGDDGVLRGVVRYFEFKGFRVLGPGDVAPETLAPHGPLSRAIPSAGNDSDIALGFEVIRVLGALDVGQAVIASGGRIDAIEGAEGTDRMLVRTAAVRALAPSVTHRAGVLVKRPKPGQELRVDMPSIGPGTVTRAAEARLEGIAVHAGNVLVAERAEVIRRADAAGLFVIGADDTRVSGVVEVNTLPEIALSPIRLGRLAPSRQSQRDMFVAAKVGAALAPYRCGSSVVVANGYVLAVEAEGEGADAVIERVEQLRQRSGVRRQRSGVAVLSPSQPIDDSMVARVVRAGLSGIALHGCAKREQIRGDVIAACDDAKIFILATGVQAAEAR